MIDLDKIKAFLFDLDGTVVDCADWHYRALNKALKEVAGFEISREDHETTYNGLPTRVKLQMLVKDGKVLENQVEVISRLKKEWTLQVVKEEAKEEVEILALLKGIKEKGFQIGLVTNSIRDFTEILISRVGLSEMFDIVITNEDVERPKPFADPYKKAVDMLKLLPEECLVVEDHPKGVTSALEAHCWVSNTTYFELRKGTLQVILDNLVYGEHNNTGSR